MATTTIRIDEDLKARVVAAAQHAGNTPHASILDALAQTVEQSELDEALHRVADARWATILETGQTAPWSDAKAWLKAQSSAGHPPHPMARKPVR